MILSVSRRTDIPAFYSDWFFERIKKGFLYIKNPMNAHQISNVKITPDVVDCIVFWTKNPAPMLNRLDELSDYSYYFQFTLNNYGTEIEPKVPPIEQRLETFMKLSEKIGKEKVIWRLLFDKQNPKTVKHGKTRKHTRNTKEKAHFKRIFKDHNGTKRILFIG